MTKHFCDRCGSDQTQLQMKLVAIPRADDTTRRVELCEMCFRWLETFIRGLATPAVTTPKKETT